MMFDHLFFRLLCMRTSVADAVAVKVVFLFAIFILFVIVLFLFLLILLFFRKEIGRASCRERV